MRHRVGLPALLTVGVCALATGCGTDSAVTPEPSLTEPSILAMPPRERVVETEPLAIDRIYPSMTGPFAWAEVDVSGLDWITAYRTEVIDAETGDKMGGEFFCHSSLQQLNTTRLVVTATGTEEIRFPEGFGLPVSQMLSGLPAEERRLRLLGMVLNNHVPEIDRMAKVRATVEYFLSQDIGDPPRLKKLYQQGLTLEVKDIEQYRPEDGPPLNPDVTTHCSLVGNFVGHWIVPPGPQLTRMRYDDFLPVDGTVHYIVVHLHNYGVYMRMTDVTTGETLWQAEPVYEPDRVQITHIPVYSSPEGIPIYKDHAYELEAYYNNTSDRNVDAMAMMWLFYHPAGDENLIFPEGPG